MVSDEMCGVILRDLPLYVLDLFPLLLLMFFFCFVHFVFWLLCGGRNFCGLVYLEFCRLLVSSWASLYFFRFLGWYVSEFRTARAGCAVRPYQTKKICFYFICRECFAFLCVCHLSTWSRGQKRVRSLGIVASALSLSWFWELSLALLPSLCCGCSSGEIHVEESCNWLNQWQDWAWRAQDRVSVLE